MDTRKNTDTILDKLIELVAKQLHQLDYSSMSMEEKTKVRERIKVELNFDVFSLLGQAQDPLTQEIQSDSIIFEKMQPLSTDMSRVVAAVYPWGWCYANSALQTKFREYCQNKEK